MGFNRLRNWAKKRFNLFSKPCFGRFWMVQNAFLTKSPFNFMKNKKMTANIQAKTS